MPFADTSRSTDLLSHTRLPNPYRSDSHRRFHHVVAIDHRRQRPEGAGDAYALIGRLIGYLSGRNARPVSDDIRTLFR